MEKHGLAARRLTALDVLAPLMFALQRKVASSAVGTRPTRENDGEFEQLSKIMEEVMPASARSAPDTSEVDFDSLADSLVQYERDLVNAAKKCEKYLSKLVWNAIEDRDRRQINALKPLEPVPFVRYRTELMPALDRSGWKKIAEKDVILLEREIETAQQYLRQCRSFQQWLNDRKNDRPDSALSAALTPRFENHRRPKSAIVGSPVARSRDDKFDDDITGSSSTEED